MLSLEDKTMLPDFAKAESVEPSLLKKIDESRGIYESRRFRPPAEGKSYGLPVLCDFGESRIGKTQQSGPFVQPHIYRAPEVIFEMPWNSAIDIWNLACLVRSTLSPIIAYRRANHYTDLGPFRGTTSICGYIRQ